MKYQRFSLIPVLLFCLSSFAQKKIGLSVSAGPGVPLHTSLRDEIFIGWGGTSGLKETNRISFVGEINIHFFQNHRLSFVTGLQLEDKGSNRKKANTGPADGPYFTYTRPSAYYVGIPLLLNVKSAKNKTNYFFGEGGLVPEFSLMNKNKNFRTSGLSTYFSAGYSFKWKKLPLFAKIIYQYGFTDLYKPLVGSNYNTRVNFLGALVGIKLF